MASRWDVLSGQWQEADYHNFLIFPDYLHFETRSVAGIFRCCESPVCYSCFTPQYLQLDINVHFIFVYRHSSMHAPLEHMARVFWEVHIRADLPCLIYMYMYHRHSHRASKTSSSTRVMRSTGGDNRASPPSCWRLWPRREQTTRWATSIARSMAWIVLHCHRLDVLHLARVILQYACSKIQLFIL